MKWKYDGYTKVHDNTRKHMIERWNLIGNVNLKDTIQVFVDKDMRQ